MDRGFVGKPSSSALAAMSLECGAEAAGAPLSPGAQASGAPHAETLCRRRRSAGLRGAKKAVLRRAAHRTRNVGASAAGQRLHQWQSPRGSRNSESFCSNLWLTSCAFGPARSASAKLQTQACGLG